MHVLLTAVDPPGQGSDRLFIGMHAGMGAESRRLQFQTIKASRSVYANEVERPRPCGVHLFTCTTALQHFPAGRRSACSFKPEMGELLLQLTHHITDVGHCPPGQLSVGVAGGAQLRHKAHEEVRQRFMCAGLQGVATSTLIKHLMTSRMSAQDCDDACSTPACAQSRHWRQAARSRPGLLLERTPGPCPILLWASSWAEACLRPKYNNRFNALHYQAECVAVSPARGPKGMQWHSREEWQTTTTLSSYVDVLHVACERPLMVHRP